MSSLEKKFGIDQYYDESVAKKESIDFQDVVNWVIKDIFTIYYVNLKNDNYVEYSSNDGFKTFNVEQSGTDFFKDARHNTRKVVYPEDYEKVAMMFNKEHLLKSLEKNGRASITYRLLIDGNETYINAAIDYADEAKDHLILCIKKVDNEIKWLKEYEAGFKRSITYSSIAYSLAKDYFIIYYIDLDNDEFIEYSSNASYKQLKVEKSGNNFFNVLQGLIFRLAHPDDVNKINVALSKDRIVRGLSKNHTYAVNFRIDYNGEYKYVRAKVMKLDSDDNHIVIGVSDIDAQMRAEQEYEKAKQLANRDALTGVKSKYAYASKEAKLDEDIKNGMLDEFAMVVCDVNDLKMVNDSKGHQEGDKYLCEACQIICETFKHSPVYRIGGDEFVAVLTGIDYRNRNKLIDEIKEVSLFNLNNDDAVIAVGMSEYVKGDKVTSVFSRADEAMYAHKSMLKGSK